MSKYDKLVKESEWEISVFDRPSVKNSEKLINAVKDIESKINILLEHLQSIDKHFSDVMSTYRMSLSPEQKLDRISRIFIEEMPIIINKDVDDLIGKKGLKKS